MNKRCPLNINVEIISLALILFFTLIANIWTLDSRNGFLMDDYSYMYRFTNLNEFAKFSLLPNTQYNDRPAGEWFLYSLFTQFGFEPIKHHAALLLLHIFNTILVYTISKKIGRILGQQNTAFPLITAAIFGMWPKSLFCVQWDAAIFDLLGATFLLVSVNLYLESITTTKYQLSNSISVILFYCLALRTKEMTILLPVILLTLDLLVYVKYNNFSFSLLKYRANKVFLVIIPWMLIYFLYNRWLGRNNVITADTSSPYFYTFSPRILMMNLLKYISLYFDLSKFEFGLPSFSIVNRISLIFFLIICLIATYFLFKKQFLQIFTIVGLILIILPVLPMKNMQHVLYLYMPSIFFGMLLSSIFVKFFGAFLLFNKSSYSVLFACLAVCFGLLSASQFPSVKSFRGWWLDIGQKNQVMVQEISTLPQPEPGTTIYLHIPDGIVTPFYIGPGYIFNVVFRDNTIKTEINPKPIEADGPYMEIEVKDTGMLVIRESDQ